MNLIKAKALVIRNIRYSDTSMIVTLFSNELGKFQAIVKGGRSLKSGFLGKLESISIVNVIFNKKDNRDLQILRDSEVLCSFKNIKSDFSKLTVAYEIVSLVDSCFHDYDKNESAFEIILSVLNLLESSKTNYNSILIFLKLRLLKSLGFEVTGTVKESETFKFYNTLQLNVEQSKIVNDLDKFNFEKLNEFEIFEHDSKKINDCLDILFDDHTFKKTNRNTKFILKSMTS